MLKTFLQSYTKSLPQSYSKLTSSLLVHPNLILYHPIQAVSAPHPLAIRLKVAQQASIPKGVNVLMIATNQSFSNIELIGATVQDKAKVNTFFQEQAKQHQILEKQDIQGLFKILIQIYANEMGSDGGAMPLHNYARLLLDQAYHDPNKSNNQLIEKLGLELDNKKYLKYIKSFHLQNILRSNENTIKKMYEILCNNFIRTTNEQQFANLLKIVRSQVREIHNNSKIANLVQEESDKKVEVLSPILPSLKESFQPNCILTGKYFTHLRQSFYCLETLRAIKGGEELSIPKRSGVNNYDKLIRYGYKSLIEEPENPHNEYLLIINLMDPQIPEVEEMLTTGDIDAKKDCLFYNDLKMKSFIKLAKDGHILHQDLKMLRILYGVLDSEQLEKESLPIDKKIYNFVGKFVQGSLQAHQTQNSKQVQAIGKDINQGIIKAFRIIEDGEIQILNDFLKTKKSLMG